eukprot:gene6933-30916_t
MLGHICIINAPAVFRFLWSIVKGYIDIRTQQKIEILGPDYKAALLNYTASAFQAGSPDWLGGQSEGTLQDDKGPWNDIEQMAKIGMSVDDLRSRQLPPPPPPGLFPMESLRLNSQGSLKKTETADVDRFHSVQASTGPNLGVTEELMTEANRRSMARGASMDRNLPATPDLAGPRLDAKPPKTLVERIAALEKLFPPHMERLKANMKEDDVAAGINTAAAANSS